MNSINCFWLNSSDSCCNGPWFQQQLDAGEETSKISAAKATSIKHCRYCKVAIYWSCFCELANFLIFLLYDELSLV